MKNKQEQTEKAALEVLRSTRMNVLEAAILARELIVAGRGQAGRARRCIEAGTQALRQQERTVTFAKAVEAALESRKERRVRTIYDFRYITRRFMKRCKGLSSRRVRAMTTQECVRYIEQAFDTPRQRQKARLILSGVFGTAVRRGWCDSNPVARVELPRVTERRVEVLTPEEIHALKRAAEKYRGGSCAAAVGMMMYAGIRPHEVARLTWSQVDMQEQAIYILPRHSKTGGARRVSICKPLLRILGEYRRDDKERICPAGWEQHWRQLRRLAGWNNDKVWQQDALRHTFASYHLCHFRSFPELQCEIGHRDATLLRTRYLCMKGVRDAALFWDE